MITTDRLILRNWQDGDIRPYHAMGRDAQVMRHLGPLTTRADARGSIERRLTAQRRTGHCFWAVERRSDRRFLGFCGLERGNPPIEGEIEIGWRLARHAWGQGYAREAAEASLAWAWATLEVPSVVAITVAANTRSWGLMERLGMRRDPRGAIVDPDYPPGDPLRRQILYRLVRPR